MRLQWSSLLILNLLILGLSGLAGCAQDRMILGPGPSIQPPSNKSANIPQPEPFPVSSDAQLSTLGTNRFQVRLGNFDRCKTTQKGYNWCWAASCQMLLKHDRIDMPQEALAAMFTDSKDESVHATVVMQALNPDLQKTLKDKALVSANFNSFSTDDAVEELSRGRPLLCGLKRPAGRHIVVIYGVTYRRTNPGRVVPRRKPKPSDIIGNLFDSGSNYEIEHFDVYDPEQRSSEPVTGLEVATLSQIEFLTTRRIAREMLLQAQRDSLASFKSSGLGKSSNQRKVPK